MIRLLMAAGAGSGTFPSQGPFSIIEAPDGGWWTEVTGPHAMYAAGKTYIGWIGGNTHPNDVEVAAWDHATRTLSARTLLHDNLVSFDAASPDSHNAPAVLVRSDGYILAVYCGHQANNLYGRISSSPNDISAFDTEFTIDPIAGTFTYPFLAELDGRIYLWARRTTGGVSDFIMSTSDDGGETWAAGISFFHSMSNPSLLYGCIASNGVDRVDFAFINEDYADPGGFGLWHFYMDDAGDVFETDGTEITGFSYPLTTTDLTQVVADGNDTYAYGIVWTGDGRPVISCQTKLTTPVELFEWRWSGSAWARHDITTSEGWGGSESVGGGVHSFADANRFLTGRVISGDTSVWLYSSSDDGVTWSGEQIGTTDPPPSPSNVMNEGAGMAFVWFTGTFTGGDDFDVGLDAVP